MPIGPLSQPGGAAKQPDKPTGQTASAVAGVASNASGGATVSFTPSTNPGKGSANYVATSGSVSASAASSPITFAAGSLVIGQAYTFTIVKQSGSGVTSDASSATSPAITAFTIPTAPTITVARQASQTLRITMTAAAAANGSTITSYQYRIKESGGSYGSYSALSGLTGPWDIGSLTNGTTYVVQVRAVNGAGSGDASNEPSAKPYGATSLSSQSLSSAAPTVTTSGYDSVSDVYINPTGSTSYGTLDYVIGTSSNSYFGSSSGGFGGLSFNTTYYFRARAYSAFHTVSVSCTANANGESSTVYFQYSTSSDFSGAGSTSSTVVTGTSNSAVSATFSGAAGALYYVRAVSVQAGSTIYGSSGNLTVTSAYVTGGELSAKTYNRYSYNSKNGSSGNVSLNKPSWGSNILITAVAMHGGGGGGDCIRGSYSGAGAGGGGQGLDSATTYTLNVDGAGNGTITVSIGGGGSGGTPGALGGYGGTTSLGGFTVAGPSVGGGNPGLNNLGGPSGSNAGANTGYDWIGGGGGGSGGSASGADGGIGSGYSRAPGLLTGGGGGAGSIYLFSESFGSATSGGGSNSAGSASTGGGGGGAGYISSPNSGFNGGSGWVYFQYIAP